MVGRLDEIESREQDRLAGLEKVGRLTDLGVVYEARGDLIQAVRDLDISVAKGEILALVGESGSGKTSAALALLGLLSEERNPPALSGEGAVLGVDMLGESTDARRELRRRHLGAIFQDPTASLNPTMTIGKQLIEAAGSEEEALALLEAVGVPEPQTRLKSYPHELSGGQRQRVMIAMAIAGEPALVVADEPTTALDVTIQAQILRLIRRLCDELRCAFVVVTHDLGVAAQIADRIAVCYAGRVVETGRTTEILAQPAHPYTAALLRSRITLDSKRGLTLATLAGEPPDMREQPPGCPFAPRCAFSRDACRAEVPPLVPAPGRAGTTACIRAHEIAEELAGPVVAPTAQLKGRAAPADGEIAVSLRGIEKSFKLRGAGRGIRLRALRGIDLDVQANECIALVGESGCGKSTLLRVVAELTEPDAGTVMLAAEGRPQMVFQDPSSSLTPWMSVGEQISEGVRSSGVPAREAKERTRLALNRVGLADQVVHKRPRELSGGQQQRVAIARAIVVPPPVLLCDEPTSSLDVSLAATVLNLLGELREELGMALIFVTHDLAVARFVADRIAVMYLGEIVEIGPAEAVTSNPGHPYTAALLASVPHIGSAPVAAKGELPSPLNPPSGCPYHPRCASAIEVCPHTHPELRPVDASGIQRAACVHVPEAGK